MSYLGLWQLFYSTDLFSSASVIPNQCQVIYFITTFLHYPFLNQICFSYCLKYGFQPNKAYFEGFGNSHLLKGLVKVIEQHLLIFI